MKLLSLLLLTIFIPDIWNSGITNVCKFTIDEKPAVRIYDHIQGIWKLAEDTSTDNYFIVEKNGDYQYVVTYMNRNGNNRGLEHFRVSLSDVDGVKFVNVDNWNLDHPGYIFFRVKSISEGGRQIAVCMVTDSSIQQVTDRVQLRALLKKNLNNPEFYSRDLHFSQRFEFNSFK